VRSARHPLSGVLYQAESASRRCVCTTSEFQEPWWLLVPSQSSALLSVRTVVLCTESMHVDRVSATLKPLGAAGLRLKVNIDDVPAACFSPLPCLLLGTAAGGCGKRKKRARFEILVGPRHGIVGR